MQIPLPIIVTIVIVILIVIWKSSGGKVKVKKVLGKKPKENTDREIAVPSVQIITAKKKGVEFKFGTLIGWAAFVAVIYLFTSCANSVVKEMAKPQPQVVKDMRRWTVIAPTNGWSDVVTTPYNYTTRWVAPNAKTILVLNIKKDDSKEEIVVTKIKDDDGIKGKALRFRSLSGNNERVDIEQWPAP